jgi:cob(I)alamin adenosyltransferase
MKTNVGSGDRGMTSLLSGERVPKSHARIEACGDLDELASALGAFAAALDGELAPLASQVHAIQGELLHIGAWIGTEPGTAAAATLAGFAPGPLEGLESSIGRMEEGLPPLTSFLLPGGSPAAAWAHVARTVCRRAERRVVRLDQSKLPPDIVPYLNRLSTWLYVAARHCNRIRGIAETPWRG